MFFVFGRNFAFDHGFRDTDFDAGDSGMTRRARDGAGDRTRGRGRGQAEAGERKGDEDDQRRDPAPRLEILRTQSVIILIARAARLVEG